MINKMKAVFKKEHIGQKVTCSICGRGIIEDVKDVGRYTISVVFNDGKGNTHYEFYTPYGYSNTKDFMPALRFGWVSAHDWDYGEPELVYKALELSEEETAWCYVGYNEDDILCKKKKRLVVASTEDNRYLGMSDGKSNKQTINTTYYKYAMRCEDLD